MIIIDLMGGLGNQLFQWALGVAIQQRGRQVEYEGSRLGPGAYRQFGLGFLGINPVANVAGVRSISEPSLRYSPDVLGYDHARLVGYWQSEKYFASAADTVRSRFWNASSSKLAGVIGSYADSVFLHVRRTDYTAGGTLRYHGLMPMGYYQEATEYVRARVTRPHFFIFSDDIAWCQLAFLGRVEWPDITFVESGSPREDLFLMANCRHAILANSTFSWWGAWLRPEESYGNGITIAPRQWFADPQAQAQSEDIVPERWIRL